MVYSAWKVSQDLVYIWLTDSKAGTVVEEHGKGNQLDLWQPGNSKGRKGQRQEYALPGHVPSDHAPLPNSTHSYELINRANHPPKASSVDT